ncbi:hypothetical protein [Anaeroselena agilis]|uniref:Uncharacterized protein n=1 Tax=Anaeroselena agilis TaxID=3063788 RepID=A0ABU3NVH8_9FIRM|nr:hypothetical protein [Selenomonadales bacterium 4137-cl]
MVKMFWTYVVIFVVVVIDGFLFNRDTREVRFCIYYAFYYGFHWYCSFRRRGEIKEESIKRVSGQEIMRSDVREIVSFPSLWGMPSYFSTQIYTQEDAAEPAMKVSLTGKGLIALADGRLNDWVIDDEAITITRKVGEGRRILLTFLGRHYTHVHLKFGVFALIPLAAINNMLEMVSFLYIILLFFAGCGVERLKDFRKIAVILDDMGIRVNEGEERERFLAYSDIAKVEKGFIHTKVTAKNGELMRFPGAWPLLPELVRKFAGLKKD